MNVRNNLVVCCRCHMLPQSQSMLGNFIGSLDFSARLWYFGFRYFYSVSGLKLQCSTEHLRFM